MFGSNLSQIMEDLVSKRNHEQVQFDMKRGMDNQGSRLFFSGRPLSGTNLVLPNVYSSHDLAARLIRIVFPLDHLEGEDLQPTFEMDIKRLNSLFSEQVKVFCIPQRKLASGMGVNPGKVSSYLREFRSWCNIGSSAKRFYYFAFSWLTLCVRDRIDVFHPIWPGNFNFPCLATDTIPELDKLLVVVKKELLATGVSISMFAEFVIGEDQQDVQNMINSPIPWNMSPTWWKIGYTRMWLWLKKPAEERLKTALAPLRSVISSKCTKDPDIRALFNQIQKDLAVKRLSRDAIAKAIKCEVSGVEKILARGKSWAESDAEQKHVYCLLLKFLDSRKFASLPEIESSPPLSMEIHHDEDLDNVDIKSASIKVGTSFLLPNPKLLSALKPVNTITTRIPNTSRPVKTVSQEPELHPIDTTVVAHGMLNEMKQGKITLKGFAECLNVNRSYFASLIRLPIPWESTTALQKSIYHAIEQWINCEPEGRTNFKKNLISFRQTQLSKIASDVGGGDSRNLEIDEKPRTQQQRVQFTKVQRDILAEKFALNPKPTASEKAIIAKELRLPMRSVVVFFCNRRRRRVEQSRQKLIVENQE